MNRLFQAAILSLAALLMASAAMAGTVTGVVRNGTTNAVVPGAEVILLQLQGGMEAVATTKADAQGRFQLDRTEIGAQPMLLRVQYRGVNYHQPVPPGATTANIEVFENTQNPGAIQVTARDIVFQPNGQTLLVGEEFAIHNQTRPPVAYYRADGTFAFSIPEGAQLNQVAAAGSSGMPVVQGTIDKGKSQSAIAFAFRPGENTVRISYQLPYASNEATIQAVSPYAVQRVILVVPPTVQVLSAGFHPAGNEQGWNIYARENVSAGTALTISVSGTAPPPNAAGNQGGESQNPSVNSRAEEGGGTSAQVLPGRIEDLKWILVGGFAALFVLGFVFLWKQSPQPVVAAPGPAKSVKVAVKLAEVEHSVHNSLDQLKETLFKLELRHQAGTISEEDYAKQRSRAEKILRDLVKG